MALGRKTGGRKKGTPNKRTADVRHILDATTSDYYTSDQFAKDIAALEPKDRLLIMEKMTGYVIAKLQTTNLEVSHDTEKTIEDKLAQLAKGL